MDISRSGMIMKEQQTNPGGFHLHCSRDIPQKCEAYLCIEIGYVPNLEAYYYETAGQSEKEQISRKGFSPFFKNNHVFSPLNLQFSRKNLESRNELHGTNRSESIRVVQLTHFRGSQLPISQGIAKNLGSWADSKSVAHDISQFSLITLNPKMVLMGINRSETICDAPHRHPRRYRLRSYRDIRQKARSSTGRIAIIFIEGNVHFREKLEKRSLGNIQTVYNPVLELEPSCLQDFLQMVIRMLNGRCATAAQPECMLEAWKRTTDATPAAEGCPEDNGGSNFFCPKSLT
ncbi:hypothetical protein T01_13655 [Trichinella spiralis]|uniref:Uncharacterized protein n=1 Tax=Trichinella spiralis TaxID=6334 RepID=A0A0V1BSG7_TRISP|nr:hypothetical protein T01_13655 [Trichinella spiralis]